MKCVLVLLMMLTMGCLGGAPTGSERAAVAAPPRVAAKEADISSFFRNVDGGFVFYDAQADRYVRYNPDRCAERRSPFSTFKVPNALIGLETGAVRDAETVIAWNPSRRDPNTDYSREPFKSWQRDHTLRSAMEYSVVWYFQEIARRVGMDKYRRYLERFGYGNEDPSSGLTTFWLNGSLKISADEQVAFLRKLYGGQLTASARSTAIVKDIIVRERGEGYTMSWKTGTGPVGGQYQGWLVGYVERGGGVYFFALVLNGPTFDAITTTRIELAKSVLRELGALPPV